MMFPRSIWSTYVKTTLKLFLTLVENDFLFVYLKAKIRAMLGIFQLKSTFPVVIYTY